MLELNKNQQLSRMSNGSFCFFVLPESTLAMKRRQNALESDTYQTNLIGVAINEVHCITEWVTMGSNKNFLAFRHFGIPE